MTMNASVNIILVDLPEDRVKFFPLSLTRPVSELRTGIFTIADKWRRAMDSPAYYLTIDYLTQKYPLKIAKNNYCINSRIIPDTNLISAIKGLSPNEGLFISGSFIACKVDKGVFETSISHYDFSSLKTIEYIDELRQISHITEIYNNNPYEINADFKTIGKKGEILKDPHTVCYNPDQIYIGEGTNIKSCILDADDGPIFIGNNVTMQPGSVVRGPAAILEDSVISINSKIRANTTIGPSCKVGGEVSQVVFQGYSNKSHDGFLGSSVIGEWCNFGAGSNNSNLKNNYSGVKLWDYEAGKFAETGLQYCGLIMGDFSKCGINTMFNTGTVVGICANIYGNGYMPKFIPSFSWGNNEGFVDYQMDKAIDTIMTVMDRRRKKFNQMDKLVLEHIFDFTAKYRGRI
jgi:UDP-N-acetylglucosamine diphosphorylase/glucosamine-1-phosphate N-acetyltransferase